MFNKSENNQPIHTHDTYIHPQSHDSIREKTQKLWPDLRVIEHAIMILKIMIALLRNYAIMIFKIMVFKKWNITMRKVNEVNENVELKVQTI